MPGGIAARADAIVVADVTKAFGGLTALDNAAIALQDRGASRAAARQRTQPLFEQLGLAGFEAARPGQLSGGGG